MLRHAINGRKLINSKSQHLNVFIFSLRSFWPFLLRTTSLGSLKPNTSGLKLKALYMYSAGFYIYSSFALVFWETRRSDFLVSMAHHIATTVLLVSSYIFKFSRVGSIILALHEGCDVFLEIAKLSKYCGYELMAGFAFVSFVLSWTVLRLIYFPFWIIWSTSYESLLTLDKEKHLVDGSIYYYLFNTLLLCLLICHIYWWMLMVRMLMKQIRARGKIDDDVRSDSEGEDEHND
ncbi:Hypothetical predicted protein [Prunus dulcis]|uniref:TLC domain-containing protein n=1 Tax=Prunus dulcis TaxID=3755 RepID=A0A5E4F0Z6_PRUDU|nr:Hypothetical predicted protein [Prunus dulcis]